MTENLQLFIPQHKVDRERARAAVAAGYPKVAPILPNLFEWLKDGNWPVAHILTPFFISIGPPIVVEVRRVLSSDDDLWKYWALGIAAALPRDIRAELHPDLIRIIERPTRGEMIEGVVEIAQEMIDEA